MWAFITKWLTSLIGKKALNAIFISAFLFASIVAGSFLYRAYRAAIDAEVAAATYKISAELTEARDQIVEITKGYAEELNRSDEARRVAEEAARLKRVEDSYLHDSEMSKYPLSDACSKCEVDARRIIPGYTPPKINLPTFKLPRS
jgi:hypothetical protein